MKQKTCLTVSNCNYVYENDRISSFLASEAYSYHILISHYIFLEALILNSNPLCLSSLSTRSVVCTRINTLIQIIRIN